MSSFDKVVGYDTIKQELMQICDMIRNKGAYLAVGAKLPKGVLLYGEPGLGKSLLSECLIEECGLPCYVIRQGHYEKDFINEVMSTFERARENSPSIVFLDDLDKFANEGEGKKDAKEYVSVQTEIDMLGDAQVLVIATVNNMDKLPDSLLRAGRFDRKIEVYCPSGNESEAIVKHYLAGKNISNQLNVDDVCKMFTYHSCAQLETFLNEAAIRAVFNKRQKVEMEDIIAAVLKEKYAVPVKDFSTESTGCRKTALHEAGHAVLDEILCPGSVGMVSIYENTEGEFIGFTRRCKTIRRRPFNVMISLAGKAAVEMEYADTVASGCYTDLGRAYEMLWEGLNENANMGFSYLDIHMWNKTRSSDSLIERSETVINSQLENYFLKTKEILYNNKEFLFAITEELLEKKTLLHSDIQAIKERTIKDERPRTGL